MPRTERSCRSTDSSEYANIESEAYSALFEIPSCFMLCELIWKRCLKQETDTPSPEGHGWMIEDGQLVIDLMQGAPAPQGVMKLIACKCSRDCKTPECECVANALKCSPACKNQFCDNMIDDNFEENGDDTADEDESDYDGDDNA